MKQLIQSALFHVNSVFPEVTQVFINTSGYCQFFGNEMECPSFDDRIDVGLIESATSALGDLPAAFKLKRLTLDDLYQLWDYFGNTPVYFEGMSVSRIGLSFMHFPIGTPQDDIWKWFESQNSDFVVGEVMSGMRRKPLISVPPYNATPADSKGEFFPGATVAEVGSLRIQDIVGDYQSPSEIPECVWIQKAASFSHQDQGKQGVWEFVLNLSLTYDQADIPPKLVPVLKEAADKHLAYLIVYQDS